MNIEANHATLAGHTFEHELRISAINGMLGSVDANQGDYLVFLLEFNVGVQKRFIAFASAPENVALSAELNGYIKRFLYRAQAEGADEAPIRL